MTWLGPLPFDVPGFPGLTGATVLWLAAFLASTLYVAPLAVRAWHGYLMLRGEEDTEAERVYALGQAIARTCGVLIVLAALVAGFVSALTPPVLPRRPFTVSTYEFIAPMLFLALLITVQSIALQWSQDAAAAVLRRRPMTDSVSQQLAEARELLEQMKAEIVNLKAEVVNLKAEVVQLREALKEARAG